MRHERVVNSSAGFPTHVYTPSVNYMQVCLFVCLLCPIASVHSCVIKDFFLFYLYVLLKIHSVYTGCNAVEVRDN